MGKRFYNRFSRIFNCKHSGGLLDKLINTIPFDAHISGSNFCGPGTKLLKRLEHGDQGIKPLDEACKEHDISFHFTKPGRVSR